VERLLVVHVAAIFEHGPEAYTDRQVAAWAAKPEGTDRYAEAIEDPEREIVVSAVEGRIVGFGTVDLDEGTVEALFVDPEWGGRGFGSALLGHLEDRLVGAGFDRVRLRAVLNTVDFYEHQGYERVEETTYTTTAGVEAAAIWLQKRL